MAVNRTIQAALTIALSIFVMLAFALGITTYLFFSQRIEAEKARDTAIADARKAEEARAATLDEMQTLRTVIGVEEDTPVAEIETGLSSLFEGDFAGFDREPKSYRRLIEWLRDQFKARAEEAKAAISERDATKVSTASDVKAAQDARAQAEEREKQAVAEKEKREAEFKAAMAEHETNLTSARSKQDEQAQRADQLALLQNEIAKGEQYMPSNRVALFQRAMREAEGAAKEGKHDDSYIKMLGLVFTELRERATLIRSQNELIASLRAASPEVQKAVAATTPADQPIDGFDGFVADVEPRTNTALVSCPTTAGMRPGLIFHVFAADDPQPTFGTRKATIELTEVQGPRLARCRIVEENPRNPVLSGDGVSTSLWAAGQSPEIAIVGFGDVDGDGQPDRSRLVALVEQAGGRVIETVGPGTALVVDLGRPPSAEGDAPAEWKAEDNRRKRALDAARDYSIRVTGVSGMLDTLGLAPDSFQPGRLPRDRESVRLPPRR